MSHDHHRAAFIDRFKPSEDVLERLDIYADLLERWQSKINLVGPKTIDVLWQRHIWDSAQLLQHIPEGAKTILDIGSGAGLPGLTLAAMSELTVHSLESDGRKIAFQRQAALAMKVMEKVVLHNKRVEACEPLYPDIITARAFAPLHKALDLSYSHARSDTLWLLPKGQNVASEIEEATKCWTFHVKQVHSETDKTATLLILKSVGHL